MKKRMILFCAASLLFIMSCNQKQSPSQTNPASSAQDNGVFPPVGDTSISASWYVRGCAEIAIKGAAEFPSKGRYGENKGLEIPGENGIHSGGDSIVYTRYVSHGCCRKVRVNTERQGQVINITEFWWGRICKCMCSSDVKAVIRQLPKGEYQVYAVETGTDPVDDKPNTGRDTVMRQIITIQ